MGHNEQTNNTSKTGYLILASDEVSAAFTLREAASDISSAAVLESE